MSDLNKKKIESLKKRLLWIASERAELAAEMGAIDKELAGLVEMLPDFENKGFRTQVTKTMKYVLTLNNESEMI